MATSIAASQKSVWGFSPQSIPGLTWWVDGMDTTSMTFSSGSNITQWRDKSGNAYHATGVNSPQKLPSGGVSFNAASSQRFSMAVPYTNTNTMFMVASPVPSTTANMYYIGQNNPNYLGAMFLGGYNSSYVSSFYPANPSVGGSPSQIPVLSAGLPTTPFLVSSVKTAAVSALGFYNGAQAYSQGDTATAGPTFWDNVGAASQGAAHLTANIYELIFFNTALSTQQRQQIEGYLASKWGLIMQLPATHPYSAVVPFLPTQIPGCQLWLDAADSSTITGTSPVTQWRDKSGMGNNPTAISGVSYSANQQAGYGTVNMGSGYITGSLSSPLSNSIFACFLVVKCTSSTNDNGIHGALTLNQVVAGGGSEFRVLEERQANFRFLTRYPSTLGVSTGAVTGSYIMWTAIASSSSMSANINGSTINTISITTNPYNASIYNIGTVTESGVSPVGWNGYIAEEIIYSGVLSDSQIKQIEQYLGQKWAIPAFNQPAAGRYLIPYNRPFYPTDIDGCSLWMDAADRSSMTFSSGSNISRWNDKSGRGNDFTVTEGTPVLSTTTIGNPGVFLPTNSQMQSVSNATENGAASRTSFIVADTPGDGTRQTQMGTGLTGAVSNVWGFHFDRTATGRTSNAMFSPYTWGNDILFLTALATLTTTTNIGFAAYNSNTTTMTGNLNFSNADSNKTITPNTAAGPWWMGDRPDGSTTGFVGKTAGNSWICEFIQYSGVLTTAQRQQVESYLSWKWKTTTSLPFPAGHPGRLLPAFSTPFTPKSVAGMQLWLDGADSSTITGTSPITAWNDKSGNGNNGTATGSPTLAQNSINGRQAVTAAVGTYFLGPLAISGPSLTCFAIATTNVTLPNIRSPRADQRLVSLANGANLDYDGTGGVIALFNWDNTSIIGAYDNNLGNVNSNTIVTGTPFMAASRFDGTTASLWFNGAPGSFPSSADNHSFSITKYGIGNQANPTIEYWSGFIGEIILFSTALTTSQRQQVEGYLAWKWGLQSSLPSTHAYAKFSP